MSDSFETPGTVAHQALLSTGFPRKRLEWVAISFSRGSSLEKTLESSLDNKEIKAVFSRGSSQARDQTHVSCAGRWVLYHWATRKALRSTYLLLDKQNREVLSRWPKPILSHGGKLRLETTVTYPGSHSEAVIKFCLSADEFATCHCNLASPVIASLIPNSIGSSK